MAGQLEFALQPESLSSGERSTLTLSISHTHDSPLHNFSMRLRGSGEVQVMGGARLQFAQLAAGETCFVELPLKGKQPGRGEIHLDRLSARLDGRAHDFPDVKLPITVLPVSAFPVQALSLLCDALPLSQNAQTDLRLRLRNDSAISLEQVELCPEAGNFEILVEGGIQLGTIAPNREAGVTLPVQPRQAGDLKLVVRLNGQSSGQPVQHTFELNLAVKPDTRPQESHTHIEGDILQVGRGHVIGNISSSTLNQPAARGRAIAEGGGISPSNLGSETAERSCPACGEAVPGGRFCDRCGHDLRSD